MYIKYILVEMYFLFLEFVFFCFFFNIFWIFDNAAKESVYYAVNCAISGNKS